MPESSYLALLLIGLLGGTHCISMCGGIVGALAMGTRPRLALHLAYNLGRIVSYAAAGAIAGALGGASVALSGQLPVRGLLYLLANLMLVALGLYLMAVTRALAFSERCGQKLWAHLQPLTRRFADIDRHRVVAAAHERPVHGFTRLQRDFALRRLPPHQHSDFRPISGFRSVTSTPFIDLRQA